MSIPNQTSIAVDMDTKVMLKQLANGLPVHRYVKELAERELSNSQGRMKMRSLTVDDFEDDEEPTGRVARLARLLATERGQNMLQMANELHYDGRALAKLFNAIIEADELGMDWTLMQRLLVEQLEKAKRGFSIRSMFGRATKAVEE